MKKEFARELRALTKQYSVDQKSITAIEKDRKRQKKIIDANCNRAIRGLTKSCTRIDRRISILEGRLLS